MDKPKEIGLALQEEKPKVITYNDLKELVPSLTYTFVMKEHCKDMLLVVAPNEGRQKHPLRYVYKGGGKTVFYNGEWYG